MPVNRGNEARVYGQKSSHCISQLSLGNPDRPRFFYYLLFQGRTLVDRPDRVALTMLAAEIALVILIASQVIGDATMLGAVLGANAVVLGAPFFMRFTRGGDARVVFLLAAGALLGYGILAIFSLDYLGLLWGIEAVALLYVVPLTNVCKESKSSPRLNCVESATCESQQ